MGEEAALLDIATLVVTDAAEDVLFAAVAKRAAEIVDAEAGAVVRYLGDERAVVVGSWRDRGTRGMPVNAELDFGPRESALGQVKATGRPARADNYEKATGEFGVVMRASGLQSSVAAPVMQDDHLWGAVVASSAHETPLAEGAEERIARLAELLGHAASAARARRRLEESGLRLVEAADATRRRLERELHEGYQQQLLALTLKVRAARARAEDGTALTGLLDDALTDAEQANAQLREHARALFPAVLHERGVAAAVQALTARCRVPAYLRELPRRRFTPVVEATVYFVVCEALLAAAARPDATEVAVRIADERDRLVVEVGEEGAEGFDGWASADLLALTDRVAAVGGRLEVGPGWVRAEISVDR